MDVMVPLHGGRHHDLVEHDGGLLDGAQDVAADDLIARPWPPAVNSHFFSRSRAGTSTPRVQAGAHLLHDLLQRTLDAVVNALDQAGAQLHAHGARRWYSTSAPGPRPEVSS